ncbi:hypothetical protein AM228_26940 [Planktothricoides sp. SR001]|nr:hypothetical protein AM228_26940 [Planktothricoides sp. SR001]
MAILTTLGILHCLTHRFSEVLLPGQEQILPGIFLLEVWGNNPETGFLFGISQLSLASNPETRFLNPRRPPRNRVSYRHITVIFRFHDRNPVS